ncbi:hypothetical protein QQF64_011708 [Cirrhinus molitorella]|uniref:Uncharacterized protein n=1 Tax=Cirrhinus molitorella TaxID=172907 RepID=A0ABR3M3H5_9TELE
MEENKGDGTKTERVHRLRKPPKHCRIKNTSTEAPAHDDRSERRANTDVMHSRVIFPRPENENNHSSTRSNRQSHERDVRSGSERFSADASHSREKAWRGLNEN